MLIVRVFLLLSFFVMVNSKALFTLRFTEACSLQKKGSSSSSSKGSSKDAGPAKPQPVVELTAASLYEREEKAVSLAELPCSLENVVSVKSVKSNTRSKPQCGICFQIYPGAFDNYELRFLPLDKVDYAKDQSYNIKLDCRDSQNIVIKQLTVNVRIEPNMPPYFSILREKVTKTVFEMNEEGLSADRCTDDDVAYGDYLTYTLLSVTPPSPSFYVNSDGVIRSSADLQAVCNSPITFVVMCEDRFEHTAPEPYTVELTLTDNNEAPEISGLNKAIEAPEDREDGASLTQFTIHDSSKTDLLCDLSAEPQRSLQYFQLDVSGTQGDVKVKSRLNYEDEETRHTNLTITCSDGFCTSAEAYLYVIVTDVNEPVTLLPKDVSLKVYEGHISVDPGWIPMDEDKGDDPVYTIVDGNVFDRFSVHPDTGVISSTVEYDVDENTMPATDTMVVQVKDEGGHVSTSTVMLTVVDSNDNRPVFTTDIVTLLTDDCPYTVGTVIGNVSATAHDRDSSFQGNNVIVYSISSSNSAISVKDNGDVAVAGPVEAGQTYSVKIRATDTGLSPGPLASVRPLKLVINVTECPPTTSTTTTTQTTTLGLNDLDSVKENWWWMALCALLLLLLMVSTGWMVWRWWLSPVHNTAAGNTALARCSKELCGLCCQPNPRRLSIRSVRPIMLSNEKLPAPPISPTQHSPLPPPLPQPVFKTQTSVESNQLASFRNPPKNGNKGFWRDNFPDDESTIKSSRNRTVSPAPAVGYGPLVNGAWRSRTVWE